MNRRDMLKTTALAAAALVLPGPVLQAAEPEKLGAEEAMRLLGIDKPVPWNVKYFTIPAGKFAIFLRPRRIEREVTLVCGSRSNIADEIWEGEAVLVPTKPPITRDLLKDPKFVNSGDDSIYRIPNMMFEDLHKAALKYHEAPVMYLLKNEDGNCVIGAFAGSEGYEFLPDGFSGIKRHGRHGDLGAHQEVPLPDEAAGSSQGLAPDRGDIGQCHVRLP